MIHDYLRTLKDERKMTNHQLAELSGVPLSSVHRILSGQTDNPSFQAICDLVVALGGSLDEMAGIKPKEPPVNASLTVKIEMLEKMITDKDRVIANKDRWIIRLVTIACALVAFILIAIVIDRMNGGFGYWRY